MNGFMVLITRFHIKRARISRSLTVYYISYTLETNNKANENQGSDNMSFFYGIEHFEVPRYSNKNGSWYEKNVPASTNDLP